MVMTRKERDELRLKLHMIQLFPDTVPVVTMQHFTAISLLDSADHFEQKCKELQAVIDNAIAVMQAAEY